MRIVYGVLMSLMLLFMAVQYNDADGLLWMAIYSVPALWCAMAAFWRQCFYQAPVRLALWGSVAMSVVGVIYYWPLTPGFWRKSVWFDVETAREGMGMMIVMAVLLLVLRALPSRVKQGSTS